MSSGGKGVMDVPDQVRPTSKTRIPITSKTQLPSTNIIISNKTEVLVSKKPGGIPGSRWAVRGMESQARLLKICDYSAGIINTTNKYP